MESVIFAGQKDTLHNTNTEYNMLSHGASWTNFSEYIRRTVVSTDGKIKYLRVKLDGAPGVGTKYTFTLMLNGNPTALTFDIVNLATSGSNMVNEIDVVAGDTISIKCVPTGTPTARNALWTSVFEGATANESLILGIVAIMHDDVPYYAGISGRVSPGTTEHNYRQLCPTSGKIKNLYVELQDSPGIAPDAYKFTLRKGNGAMANTLLTVTITAPNTTGFNIIDEVAVAAGDFLSLRIDPLNGPAAEPTPNWGMTFVADTDGESAIIAGAYNDLNPGLIEYNKLIVQSSLTWTTTEDSRYQLGQSCVLRKFYVELEAAPGAGKSYTFIVRINGVDGNLTVTIADAATTGSDLVNTDAIANDDYVGLKCTPANTPDVVYAKWGLVSHPPIPPPPPLPSYPDKTGNIANKMVAAGLI